MTVSARCNVTIDHHTPTVNLITNLDIKTYAEVMVITDREATTTLKGHTLTVRSGAKVRMVSG